MYKVDIIHEIMYTYYQFPSIFAVANTIGCGIQHEQAREQIVGTVSIVLRNQYRIKFVMIHNEITEQ